MKLNTSKLILLLLLTSCVTSCASNQPLLQAVACPAMTQYHPPESTASQPYLDELKRNQQSFTEQPTPAQ